MIAGCQCDDTGAAVHVWLCARRCLPPRTCCHAHRSAARQLSHHMPPPTCPPDAGPERPGPFNRDCLVTLDATATNIAPVVTATTDVPTWGNEPHHVSCGHAVRQAPPGRGSNDPACVHCSMLPPPASAAQLLPPAAPRSPACWPAAAPQPPPSYCSPAIRLLLAVLLQVGFTSATAQDVLLAGGLFSYRPNPLRFKFRATPDIYMFDTSNSEAAGTDAATPKFTGVSLQGKR